MHRTAAGLALFHSILGWVMPYVKPSQSLPNLICVKSNLAITQTLSPINSACFKMTETRVYKPNHSPWKKGLGFFLFFFYSCFFLLFPSTFTIQQWSQTSRSECLPAAQKSFSSRRAPVRLLQFLTTTTTSSLNSTITITISSHSRSRSHSRNNSTLHLHLLHRPPRPLLCLPRTKSGSFSIIPIISSRFLDREPAAQFTTPSA